MKVLTPLGQWLLGLFNAPPRASLTVAQKIGRIFLVTGALVTFSIIVALLAAVTLFLVQRVEFHRPDGYPLAKILAVLLDSLLVNVVCVFVLLQIKRLDETLIPPPGPGKS
jgi:hypothetical protein